MYVLVQVVNSDLYYLKESTQVGNTWISNASHAITFQTKGQAQYYAARNNVRRYLVKPLDS